MTLEIQIAIVFLLTTALDFVWAQYTFATTNRQPALAGLYAIGIYGLGGLATIGYTENHWLLLPAIAGCFVGTYAAVRRT
jgi:hypothetical protein